jgi:hypothetical protein
MLEAQMIDRRLGGCERILYLSHRAPGALSSLRQLHHDPNLVVYLFLLASAQIEEKIQQEIRAKGGIYEAHSVFLGRAQPGPLDDGVARW